MNIVESPKEAQNRNVRLKTCGLSCGLSVSFSNNIYLKKNSPLLSCVHLSLNGSPWLLLAICLESPSTPGHPCMSCNRFLRSSVLEPRKNPSVCCCVWLPDSSAFLQDQFWHPLVDASALLAVDPHLLQPAVVSLRVLQMKQTTLNVCSNINLVCRFATLGF